MGLLFNGTTVVPASNNVYFNGTAVDKVYFNGTEVWAKQTNPVWSGNSIMLEAGIDVTANLCRAQVGSTHYSWITATSSGFNTVQSGLNTDFNIKSQGNTFTQIGKKSNSTTSCTWNLTTRLWTGSSSATIEQVTAIIGMSLQTSVGLIRAGFSFNKDAYYGAYISLK